MTKIEIMFALDSRRARTAGPRHGLRNFLHLPELKNEQKQIENKYDLIENIKGAIIFASVSREY